MMTTHSVQKHALALIGFIGMGLGMPMGASETPTDGIRSDYGFDFFDYVGSFIGQHIPNVWGGYDFYDAQGMFLGSSRSRVHDRVDFFDMTGNLVKIMSLDSVGNTVLSRPDGAIEAVMPDLVEAQNYLRGAEFFYSITESP
jgi:hypothetical protein